MLALFDKPDPLEGPYFEESIYVTPSRLPEEMQTHIFDCAHEAIRARWAFRRARARGVQDQ